MNTDALLSSAKMKILLWLDDVRNPFKNNWLALAPRRDYDNVVWVKSYDEAVKWVSDNGLPYAMCLDHDLGIPRQLELRAQGYTKRKSRKLAKEKNGYDFAKWIVNYCLDNNEDLPYFSSQSANSVGRENIIKLLTNFTKFR